MATATITQLPAADLGAVDDTTVLPVDDANAETRKLTLAELRTALGLAVTVDGDVSGAADIDGAVTLTLTIDDGVVSLAKLANIASGRLIGRSTGGTGVPELISIGLGLSLAGGVLSVSAAQNASDASPLHDHRAFGGL